MKRFAKKVGVEKKIRQRFIVELNYDKGKPHSDDTVPNKETNTFGIKDNYFGAGLDDFVQVYDKKKKNTKKRPRFR